MSSQESLRTGAAESATVAAFARRPVVGISVDATLVECARLMHDRHVGSLIVLSSRDGRDVPIGMLTDRDIATEVVAFQLDPSALTAEDIMSGPVICLPATTTLSQALTTMREAGVRRLPLVDAQGELTGIVSVDDLFAALTEQLSDLVLAGQAARDREHAQRSARARPE